VGGVGLSRSKKVRYYGKKLPGRGSCPQKRNIERGKKAAVKGPISLCTSVHQEGLLPENKGLEDNQR